MPALGCDCTRAKSDEKGPSILTGKGLFLRGVAAKSSVKPKSIPLALGRRRPNLACMAKNKRPAPGLIRGERDILVNKKRTDAIIQGLEPTPHFSSDWVCTTLLCNLPVYQRAVPRGIRIARTSHAQSRRDYTQVSRCELNRNRLFKPEQLSGCNRFAT